jgi:hypothetical protein
MFRGTYRERVLFTGVEVIDEEIQMELLGDWPLGPRRSDVTIDLLKRKCRMGSVVEFDPLHVVGSEITEGFYGKSGESRVEAR